MNTTLPTLQFDPQSQLLKGPAGSLSVPPTDEQARRFLMLVEGECLQAQVTHLAQKYGFCRQRYYQMLADYQQGGLAALLPKKTGPKLYSANCFCGPVTIINSRKSHFSFPTKPQLTLW